MRRALLLLPLLVPLDSHAERGSMGLQFAYRQELTWFAWWLPNGMQTRLRATSVLDIELSTSGFRTPAFERHDALDSAVRHRLTCFGAGLLVRISNAAYVVGGGGIVLDGLSTRYGVLAEDADWIDVGGEWRAQAFAGAGARWTLGSMVKGGAPLSLGIDVRGIALSGHGPSEMAGDPEVPRLSLQGSMILGMLL